MKIGIICVLAFVALVNGLDNINTQENYEMGLDDLNGTGDLQVCEPNSTKKEDCNNCFCARDGSGWACTRMLCSPLTYVGQDANVDEPHQNKPKDRVKREFGNNFTCTPNETFMDDCNHCFCLADGRSAGCTLMACPPKNR